MHRALRAAAVVLLTAGATGSADAQRSRPAAPTDDVVVSTAWLASHLNDPHVVVLHVDRVDSLYARGHVPGARFLPYAAVATRRGGLQSELPEVDSLRAAFERVGVSDASHVVVTYSAEAPSATRAIMALDYLGHAHVSLLDGGLPKWRAEGRAVAAGAPSAVARGTLRPRPRATVVATADWITPRLGRPGIALIDTRTDGEYLGTETRGWMTSGGHLAGARQLEWQQLFQGDSGSAGGAPLKDPAALRALFAERMQPGDTVVTYCWVGYRASATYFAARMLGLPVRLYDGSYEEWSQQQRPVRAGATP